MPKDKTQDALDDEVIGELNAEEIYTLDNLSAARAAAMKTFEIAMNFHMNRLSLLENDLRSFWKGVSDRLGFDYPERNQGESHRIERRNGTTVVVAVDADSEEWRVGVH